MRHFLSLLLLSLLLSPLALAEPLPAPALPAGLQTPLQARQSVRTFTGIPPTQQQLANLLWAAYGVNRESGKQTVPAALNRHAFTLYVLTREGVLQYLPQGHQGKQVSSQNLLAMADGSGRLGPAAGAAILLVGAPQIFDNLGAGAEKAAFYLGVEAGTIVQDIYLACAAQGLGAVCCGSLNAEAISEALQLPPDRRPLLTVVVGTPAP
ncbi:MAG: nitroreductase family protein [Oligosphaeraceae bacterium]